MPEDDRDHSNAVPAIHRLIDNAEEGKHILVLSALLFAEVRKFDNAIRERADQFQRWMSQRTNLHIHDVDLKLAGRAAELGNRCNLDPIDSVLLATAITVGATAECKFYTLDKAILAVSPEDYYLRGDKERRIKPVDGFEVVNPREETLATPPLAL